MTRPDYKTDQTWFKQLFDSSPDPAWIIDGNRFVECNDAAIRTLGYAAAMNCWMCTRPGFRHPGSPTGKTPTPKPR
jgi:PAS domain-containing protein